MRRRSAIAITALVFALTVLPAPTASAGGSTVFIGGPPALFSLCAEFGTAPNNWILTVQLSPTVFVQYGSGDANKSKFGAQTGEGLVKDNLNIKAEDNSNVILGSLEATYKDGGQGIVDFVETSPIKVKYRLKAPATVDLTANCSATFT